MKKIYMLLLIFVLFVLSSCAARKVQEVKSHNPTSTIKKEYTLESMEDRLKSIQRTKKGIWISKQKRDAYREIDTVIKENRVYKKKIALFEKSHPYIEKKRKKQKLFKLKEEVYLKNKNISAKEVKGKYDDTQFKYY